MFFFVEDPYFSINIKFEHAKLNPGPIDENHNYRTILDDKLVSK